jgi:hypothetical protein
MLSTEQRLEGLWLKVTTARDPSEKDILLFEFRDAVHELLDQVKAETKTPMWACSLVDRRLAYTGETLLGEVLSSAA